MGEWKRGREGRKDDGSRDRNRKGKPGEKDGRGGKEECKQRKREQEEKMTT